MSDELIVTLGGTAEDNPFLQLGRAIAGQCPAGFAEARLEAELGGEGAGMRLACTPSEGSEAPLAIDAAAQGRIRSLLEAIRDHDERRWRRCTVTLRKGGGFRMDVDY